MATQEGPRDAGVVLHHLEDGQFMVDVSTELHALTTKIAQAAANVGQAKGELQIRLKLHADEGGTVQIDGEIVVKEPKVKRARTVMWLSKGANLVRENPKQQQLFPREVPNPGTAAREVPAQSAEPRSV